MKMYSGVKAVAEILTIPNENILGAFSFYSGNQNNNIVYPDFWATGSSSGILFSSTPASFFTYSGSGFFNGNTIVQLNKVLPTTDLSFFISYEKLRHGDEILISSVTGNSFNNYSGFYLGINDANKLYFKYWNPVEGIFTFTYENILSNKNLIYLNIQNSIVSLGKYNTNNYNFDIEDFFVFENAFINSNLLCIGGKTFNDNYWFENVNNFSGYIDKFFIFKDLPTFYIEEIASGLYSNVSAGGTTPTQFCYTTGSFFNSGFIVTGITGVLISGKDRLIGTGVTGQTTVITGFEYSGVTGRDTIYLGSYIDNCGISQDIYQTIELSGLIREEFTTIINLTGQIIVREFEEIILTGIIQSGSALVRNTGESCINVFNINNITYSDIDYNYLPSLSFSEISLLSEDDNNLFLQDNILEVYTEPYQHKTLDYNKELAFDSLNQNFFYTEKEFKTNEILLFANGQAIIDSGNSIEKIGYETLQKPALDYFLTGLTIETNQFYGLNDKLFYDYFPGNFTSFKTTGFIPKNSKIEIESFNNPFVYLNGQKLVQNIDYNLFKTSFYDFNLKQTFSTGSSILSFSFGNSSLSANQDFSIIGMNDPVVTNSPNILDSRPISGCVGIYTGNKNDGWNLKEIIYSPSTGNSDRHFGSKIKFSHDGTVLAISRAFGNGRTGELFIYTGSANNTYILKQSIRSLWPYLPLDPGHIYNISINNDGSSIIFQHGSSNLHPTGNTFEYTGSKQNGWILNYIFPASGSSLCADSNHSTLGIGVTLFRADNQIGSFPIFKKNQNNWALSQILTGNNLTIQNSDYLGYNSAISNDAKTLILNGSQNNSGVIWIYKQENEQFNLNQTINMNNYNGGNIHLGYFNFSNLEISKNGNIFLVRDGRDDNPGYNNGYFMFTGSKNNFYFLKTGFIYENGDYNTSLINTDGSIFLLGKQKTSSPRSSFVDIYTGISEQSESFFILQDIPTGNNYFIIKESNNNFNRYFHTGRYINNSIMFTGSLKINKPFNHGCSQVYYNGIKQKLNQNYIENSDFDMLSGTFFKNNAKNLIYNNSDNFFNINN